MSLFHTMPIFPKCANIGAVFWPTVLPMEKSSSFIALPMIWLRMHWRRRCRVPRLSTLRRLWVYLGIEGECWNIQSRHIAIWAIYLGAWEVRWASIARRDAWCDGHPYWYYFDGISSYINYTVLTRLGHVGRTTHLSHLSFDWGEYGIFYLLLTLLIVMYLSLNSYSYTQIIPLRESRFIDICTDSPVREHRYQSTRVEGGVVQYDNSMLISLMKTTLCGMFDLRDGFGT